MLLDLFQIDAFTGQVFAGNPAAVVPLSSWLPDAVLQQVAEENNLSETAFLVTKDDRNYHLRWFTPKKEVDLCGHATLATAHYLYTQADYPHPEVTFHTRSGMLTVGQTEEGYQMSFPKDDPVLDPSIMPEITRVLGQPPKLTLKGKDDYLAILEHGKMIADLVPDMSMTAQLKARGLIVSAPGSKYDFVSRCFYPAYGIEEDPVTGSAHTLLAPFWSEKLNKKTMIAFQKSARGGTVHCTMDNDRVILAGTAVTYLCGKIKLPDGIF